MGISLLRNLHVPGMLREAPRLRRAHLLRQIRYHGLVVRDPNQENGLWRKQWKDPPPVVGAAKKPPLSQGKGWDDWGIDEFFRCSSDFRGMKARGAVAKTRSSEDIYSRSQLEASAASKESFFAKRMTENESKPEGLPPSQGGKYVGFGSSPGPAPRCNHQSGDGDVFSVMSEIVSRCCFCCQCCSDRNHGLMEFTSKVKEGGLDNTVSETVNVVASKTTEIGQRTWGIMKGVMAIASQKVEEFTKEEASTWNQQNKNRFHDNKAATNSPLGGSQSSSSYQNSYRNSSSWDDWGEEKDNTKMEAAPKVSQSSSASGYGNNYRNSNSWDD